MGVDDGVPILYSMNTKTLPSTRRRHNEMERATG